jgi:hypothetical protein
MQLGRIDNRLELPADQDHLPRCRTA